MAVVDEELSQQPLSCVLRQDRRGEGHLTVAIVEDDTSASLSDGVAAPATSCGGVCCGVPKSGVEVIRQPVEESTTKTPKSEARANAVAAGKNKARDGGP